MDTAEMLRALVSRSAAPVEFAQGNYRLRVMPGAGRIRDINFSIWEERERRWEPIVAGWVKGSGVIVSAWTEPGSPANAEALIRFALAGRPLRPEEMTPDVSPWNRPPRSA